MNIYLKYIIDSFIINYKSWLAFIISIYTIRRHNFLIVVINLIILLMYSHIAHYIWHLNYIYPINIIHTNHHSNDNTYSEVAEIIMEIMLFIYLIAIKHLFNFDIMYYLDEWVVLLVCLYYITVHNINYSILRVNNTHRIHHDILNMNMGPDICDLIFNTKYKPELGVENTDHYIPNIIFSTIIIKIWQLIFNKNKRIYNSIFKVLVMLATFFLYIVSVILHIDDINKNNGIFQNKLYNIHKILHH